jgi:hypothetical protein
VKYLPVWKTAFRIKKILQHVLDEPYATLKSKLVRLPQPGSHGSLTLCVRIREVRSSLSEPFS